MKKLYYLLVALMGVYMVACVKDENMDNGRPAPNEPAVDKITLSQQTIEVGFEPDIYTIDVTSPYSWKAESDNDWIVVDSKTGIAGTEQLSFSIARNEEEKVRKGTIAVKNSDFNLITEFYITQIAFVPEIFITPSTLCFSIDGGEECVAVIANFKHNATTDADWLTIAKTGEGYTITAPGYFEVEERTAEVVVFSEKYNVSKSIAISQNAFEPILNVEDKSVLVFDYKGGEQSILVESNFEYGIATDADWVTLSKTTTGVLVIASVNRSDARTANVTISSAKYDLSEIVIPIIQQEFIHEAVDLGLSVKWAACNVGANSPDDYGDYFAWGETSPKSSYISDNCLTYGVSMSDISGNPQYDSATANWGGDWRMPTMAEQDELRNNCTWEWTTLNGVNGLRVTGPNGNSIFLPFAGDVGSRNYYWSSTPYGVNSAYILAICSDGYGPGYGARYIGNPVRPVLE